MEITDTELAEWANQLESALSKFNLTYGYTKAQGRVSKVRSEIEGCEGVDTSTVDSWVYELNTALSIFPTGYISDGQEIIRSVVDDMCLYR